MPERRKFDDQDQEGSPNSQEGAKITRRTMLVATAGTVGATILKTAADAIRLVPTARAKQQVPPDPTKVQGRLANSLGQRSVFEQPRRLALGTRGMMSLTPLQDLDGTITPGRPPL